MHRNSQPTELHSTIPTLQSIDAHSEVSIDLRPNQLQPLISKIFLLCLELQRKDQIIDELQTQVQFKNEMRKSQIDVTNKQFMIRYDRIEQENRILIESNVMLKNNVVTMERVIADLQVHKERSAYNKELEEKVYSLELKLKKAEEEKIEYLEREKNLKRQNSMLSYSAIKTSQKNRIRDLEYELSQEKLKLDTQKRINADLKYQVEKDITEIKNLKESEHILKRTYEQKIQKIQMVKANQDLRQSQCTAANEEKIALLSQQLNRLRQELEHQRSAFKQEKLKIQQKDGQIRRLLQDIRSLQQSLKSKHKVFESFQSETSTKQQEQLKQIQILSEGLKNYKQSQTDIESFMKQKHLQQQEKNRQIQRLRIEVQELQKNREEMNIQLKKAKRKNIVSNSDCQICKIRSSTIIQSSKSIGNSPKSTLNLEEIIQETEKLNLSNKKVQSLINHHEISVQYSTQTTIINTSQ